jgi:hypothetical protein
VLLTLTRALSVVDFIRTFRALTRIPLQKTLVVEWPRACHIYKPPGTFALAYAGLFPPEYVGPLDKVSTRGQDRHPIFPDLP